MRKIISSVLCLAMLLSMGTTAFASNISTDGGSHEVTVTYGVSQSFNVTIPSEITFRESTETVTISANDVIIPVNKSLIVSVDSETYDGRWRLTDTTSTDNFVLYDIYTPDNEYRVGGIVPALTVNAGQSQGSVDLEFVLRASATKAGTYTDTLTFTVDVVEFINFSIVRDDYDYNVTYQAEKGMTWGEWVESEYNYVGWGVTNRDNKACIGKWDKYFGDGCVKHDDGSTDFTSIVIPEEEIVDNEVYTVWVV